MPIPYFAIQSGCIHPHPHNIHIHISSSRACSLGFGFKASKASFSSMTRVGTAISFSAFGKPPGLIVNMVPERPGYQTWGFLAPKSCHVRLSARIFIRTWSSGMVNGAMMYDVQLYQYMSACIHGLSQSPEYAGEMQKRYAAWGLKWNVRQLGFCSWTEANPRLKRILVDLPMLHLEAHMYIYIYMNVNANTTKMRFQRMRSMHICIYIKSLLVEATQICQAVPQPVGFRSAEFVWFVSQELPKIPGFHIILFPAFWACSKQTNRHHYKNLTICFWHT